MDKSKLWHMAFDSGLCDRDLGQGKQLMTDYGDATDAVERFAEMVSAAEREACAAECERMMMYPGGRQEAPAHGNVWSAAKAIRERSNA
jgi:hypothetical protein